MTTVAQEREDAALGAAWRRCQAALPKGWYFEGLTATYREWQTRAWRNDDGRYYDAFGPTPTAALEALADKLESLPR